MNNNEVVNYKCPACSAKLMYNPETKSWKCEYCNSEYMVKLEYSIESKGINLNSKENMEIDEYSCPSCGAKIITDDNTVATFCTYCNNSSIIKNRLTSELKPDGIIPFSFSKEQVINKFKKLKKEKIFIPNNIDKNIKITGMYVPFWLFDCDVIGIILGKKSEEYVDLMWGLKNYDQKSYYYGSVSFEKIPVDAGKKIDDNLMDSIEPFDYNELKEFTPAYLSGFFATKYDLESHEVFERAETRIKNAFEKIMVESMDNNYIGIEDEVQMLFNEKDYKYVFMPIWFVDIKWNNKIYKFALNGQTGKMAGDLPISFFKIFLWFIILFIILIPIIGGVYYLLFSMI